MLHHPELQGVSCAECKRWLVNIKTGKFDEWPRGSGKRISRSDKISTPCHECPKVSPERESEFVLSAKNWRTLQLYLEAQGTCGQAIRRFAADPILRRNFAVLHNVFEQHRAMQLTLALSPLTVTVSSLIQRPMKPRR